MDLTAGDLLISPSNIPDNRFNKSVILLMQHTEEGSFGLCINRPTKYVLSDVLEGSDSRQDIFSNIPLYWGGPVNPQSVWMIHDSDWSIDTSLQISREWSMTSNSEMFTEIALGNLPNRFRFMIGFSAWGSEQLENEIQGTPPWNRDHSWLIAKQPDPQWLLDRDDSMLWSEAIELSANQAVESWI